MSRAVVQVNMADISQSALTRHAGWVAVIAGAFVVVTHLALWAVFDRGRLQATLADPLFQAINATYFFALCGLAIALVAVHAWQARAAGILGVLGFCAALVGIMNLGGNMWFEGFVGAWVVQVAPQTLVAEKSALFTAGALSSYLLFAVGWMLFGLASLRARVYPVAICIAIVVAGAIGYLAAAPPFGVPIGLAIAWLGVWMVRASSAGRLAESA